MAAGAVVGAMAGACAGAAAAGVGAASGLPLQAIAATRVTTTNNNAAILGALSFIPI